MKRSGQYRLNEYRRATRAVAKVKKALAEIQAELEQRRLAARIYLVQQDMPSAEWKLKAQVEVFLSGDAHYNTLLKEEIEYQVALITLESELAIALQGLKTYRSEEIGGGNEE